MGPLEEWIEDILITEKQSDTVGVYDSIDPRRMAEDLAPDIVDRLENDIANLVYDYLLDNY